MAGDQDNGTDAGPRQISVSRDALRADLGDLEMRMRNYISTELEKKADSGTVSRLVVELDLLKAQAVRRDERTVKSWEKFENGDMSPNQILAIQKVAQEAFKTKEKEGWSSRERVLGTITCLVSVVALVFTSIYTVNAVEHNQAPATNTITTTGGR